MFDYLLIGIILLYVFIHYVPQKFQLTVIILIIGYVILNYYAKVTEEITIKPSTPNNIKPKIIEKIENNLNPIDIKINRLSDENIRKIVNDSKSVGSFNLVEFIELIDYLTMFQKIDEGMYYKCKYFIDNYFELKNKILNTYNSFIHNLPPPMDSKIYQTYHYNMQQLEQILNEKLAKYSYKCQELSYQDINTDSYMSQDLILAEKPANTFKDNRYQYFL